MMEKTESLQFGMGQTFDSEYVLEPFSSSIHTSPLTGSNDERQFQLVGHCKAPMALRRYFSTKGSITVRLPGLITPFILLSIV